MLFYGFFVGLFIAITGAWKDTLFEDFDIKKFFRSPLITEFWYIVLLYVFSDSILLIAIASASLERFTVEGWKALIRKPPGKFMRPQKDRGWLLERLG